MGSGHTRSMRAARRAATAVVSMTGVGSKVMAAAVAVAVAAIAAGSRQ